MDIVLTALVLVDIAIAARIIHRSHDADGPDRWILDHPWKWALIGAPIGLVALWRFTDNLALTVIVGVAVTAYSGWSLSQGPARRRIARRRGVQL